MTIRASLMAGSFALVLSSTAQANDVYLEQVGPNNSAVIDQTGVGNTVGTQQSALRQFGDNNVLEVNQQGNNNAVQSIRKYRGYYDGGEEVESRDGHTKIDQAGNGNIASYSLEAGDLTIKQEGSANTIKADLMIPYNLTDNNNFKVSQSGDGNNSEVSIVADFDAHEGGVFSSNVDLDTMGNLNTQKLVFHLLELEENVSSNIVLKANGAQNLAEVDTWGMEDSVIVKQNGAQNSLNISLGEDTELSNVDVEQTGNLNSASLSTIHNLQGTALIRQDGAMNAVMATQSGIGSFLSVSQNGVQNTILLNDYMETVLIDQRGAMNIASVSQSVGESEFGLVGNYASIAQDGISNNASVTQSGPNGHTASLKQEGTGNSAVINQH